MATNNGYWGWKMNSSRQWFPADAKTQYEESYLEKGYSDPGTGCGVVLCALFVLFFPYLIFNLAKSFQLYCPTSLGLGQTKIAQDYKMEMGSRLQQWEFDNINNKIREMNDMENISIECKVFTDSHDLLELGDGVYSAKYNLHVLFLNSNGQELPEIVSQQLDKSYYVVVKCNPHRRWYGVVDMDWEVQSVELTLLKAATDEAKMLFHSTPDVKDLEIMSK